MNSSSGHYRGTMLGFVLAAVVLVLYGPVGGYDFIGLDDNLYVLDNDHVQQGISLNNLVWAMTTFDAANWHPLTWLSLIADYDLFGLSAGGYHVHSLLLHLLNTLLLFIILRRMTGEDAKCAIVAALFAVHPLNIESVVWIAERKNLLSTLLAFLTIFAYVRYAEQPGWQRYWPVCGFFALGLMAKPMLVTLPFVLLLLDYWPLGRFSPSFFKEENSHPGSGPGKGGQIIARLLIEKIPFFFLSLISAILTFTAARSGGAVKSLIVFPFFDRMANAFTAYGMYLAKMVRPTDLAIFYPYPVSPPQWHAAAALIMLALVTGLAFLKGKRHPYLIVGWLWYVITLVPVIGFVQVGFQSMANRYAYLPLIGIFIIVVWGLSDLVGRAARRRYLIIMAGVFVFILAFSTWSQLPDWQNSEAVFEKALAVTKNNHIANTCMGNVWLGRGDLKKAKSFYEEALRIKPDYPEAHNNLALTLLGEGKTADAADHYRTALSHKPDYAEAYGNLGAVLASQGEFREAETCLRRALNLKPGHGASRKNLSMLLLDQGRIDEAIDGFRTVLKVLPHDEGAKRNLAEALRRKGLADREPRQ